MQARTILVVLVTLVVGFVAGFALRPSIAPVPPSAIAAAPPLLAAAEPRGTQYFDAHLEEARAVVAGCKAGSARGAECANAEGAVIAAEGKARTRKFLGN